MTTFFFNSADSSTIYRASTSAPVSTENGASVQDNLFSQMKHVPLTREVNTTPPTSFYAEIVKSTAKNVIQF